MVCLLVDVAGLKCLHWRESKWGDKCCWSQILLAVNMKGTLFELNQMLQFSVVACQNWESC